MFDANIVARSHFTSEYDGETSFGEFLKVVGLLDCNVSYKLPAGKSKTGKPVYFKAVSWGGFFNSSNEWTIFVSWRCAALNTTIYSHWSWDSESLAVFNRRDFGFTN